MNSTAPLPGQNCRQMPYGAMFKCTLSSYLFSMHSDIIYEWLQSAVGLPQARAVQFNSQTVTHTLSSEGSKNAV